MDLKTDTVIIVILLVLHVMEPSPQIVPLVIMPPSDKYQHLPVHASQDMSTFPKRAAYSAPM